MSLSTLLLSSLSYPNPWERILSGFASLTPYQRGQVWEELCQKYLLALGYEQVWTLKQLPLHARQHLSLTTKDMGIDLIAYHQGKYSAVQCKFRSPSSRDRKTISIPGKIQSQGGGDITSLGVPKKITLHLNRISWRDLSTFYALCSRSENWSRLIVMTNAKSINRQGKKGSKDLTYAVKTFENTDRKIWLAMAGSVGHSLSGEKATTQEDLRNRRLAYYEKNKLS